MKIIEKLKKTDDSFSVNIYDNGFMIEVSGRDHEDEYATAKVICVDIKEVHEVIDQIVVLPRD